MKYQIFPSKSKLNTIKNTENSQFIHSLYDPLKEAKRIYNTFLENYKSGMTPILWGCGLGYVLDEILSAGPYPSQIYCFEPHPGIWELEEVKKNY